MRSYMDMCVLEVTRFEYFLTDYREDLSEEVLNMFLSNDLLDGMSMQLF